MSDETYSKREQDHFFGELFKRMDKQDETLGRIEGQTTKTNGRVTKLEEKTDDYPSTRKTVQWIMGVGAAAIVLGAVIYGFALKFANDRIDAKFTDFVASSQKKTEQTANYNNTVNVQ